MMKLPDTMTIGEAYGPAMEIKTEEEAKEYFEALVERCMRGGKSREESEKITRNNLGYYAGYYDNATRARVERLFSCAHPVFGAIAEVGAPTMEEAFEMGMKMGERLRNETETG